MEFHVRRASWDVPSSMTLHRGDVLVMDGPAQSEYVHCTASGLQGPRVNLTYRWVTQHAASCPLAAQWAVSSLRVRKVQPSRVLEGNGVGEINGPLFGVWSFFC